MASIPIYGDSAADALLTERSRNLPGSEAFYRNVIEEQTEVICRCRPEGAITFVNNAFCRYFERTREELIGHRFISLIAPEDRDKVEKHFSSLTDENPVAAIEHRVLLPSGAQRWQQRVDRAIFDGKGRLVEIQSVGRDLTERIHAENLLQESENRYRSLISKMGNGFALSELVFDQSGNPCGSRFLEVNPAFEQIAGIRANEIVGKTVGEVFPGTESFWVDKCGQVALSGTAVQFKNCSKLFNRYFEIIAYSPVKGQVAAVFTNITERMEMQTALRESENDFRAIAENANDGILIGAGFDHDRFIYANRKACNITGFNIIELLNMGFEDLVHPDEFGRISQRYPRKMLGEPVTPYYETIFVKKDGSHMPVEVTKSQTFWHGQLAVMVVFRDISMRKRFEEALGKSHSDLEIRVQERTNVLMEVTEKLEEKQRELMRHKLDLEKANLELVRTNIALSVLARNIDKKRDEVEKKMARIISAQIMPLLKEIKHDKLAEKTLAKLNVLDAYLSDLTPGAARGHDIIISLSAMELRVVVMIKNGFSSAEIAHLLHISPHTVKTHRKNIRRKLKLKNSDINLASYLKLKLRKTDQAVPDTD
jgi:PAS domain S-box-containing protein